MTEKQKCQKCGVKATTQLGLTKDNGEKVTLILCDTCYKEEITCQECKQEIKTLKIQQITKSDGSAIRACEECYKKIQEINQSVQKSRELKKELEKYIEFGERGATCKIKENLTKDQLLEFKKLLEDNMTGEPSPTNGGEWLGWKRGTPEIEEALKAEGTGVIRQPYCYWLEVKKKIEELEKQEHVNNQTRERERERESVFSLQLGENLNSPMLNQPRPKLLIGISH